jgi:hypothetical protein
VVDVYQVVVALAHPAADAARGEQIVPTAPSLRDDLDVDVRAQVPQGLDLFVDEDAAEAVALRPHVRDREDAQAAAGLRLHGRLLRGVGSGGDAHASYS